MQRRAPDADPYLASGDNAEAGTRRRMKIEALNRSIRDADELQARGLALVARSERRRFGPWAALTVAPAATVALGLVALNSYDGTYEGAMLSNWSMLGATLCIGGAIFALGWMGALKQLAETGQRLQRRAEYQRRLGLLQLSEITEAEDAALR